MITFSISEMFIFTFIKFAICLTSDLAGLPSPGNKKSGGRREKMYHKYISPHLSGAWRARNDYDIITMTVRKETEGSHFNIVEFLKRTETEELDNL